MQVLPAKNKPYNHVYFSLNEGLVLYTQPSADNETFKNDFKQYKHQVEIILEPLQEILQEQIRLNSQNVLLWSSIPANHPSNQLLNLLSFIGSDERCGFGQSKKANYALQKDKPITVEYLCSALTSSFGCSNELAHETIQLINSSKETFFSSDIASISENHEHLKPGISKIESFDELTIRLRNSVDLLLKPHQELSPGMVLKI